MAEIIVRCILVVLLAAAPCCANLDSEFRAWVEFWGRNYTSIEEQSAHFSYFVKNRDDVLRRNTIEPNALYELNNRSDWLSDTLRSASGCGSSNITGYILPDTDTMIAPLDTDGDIDWRLRNAVTPVKDQGQHPVCWSFSGVGNIEGQWALARRGLTALSEQQVIDCHAASGAGPYGMDYAVGAKLTSEAKYPYVGDTSTCNMQ